MSLLSKLLKRTPETVTATLAMWKISFQFNPRLFSIGHCCKSWNHQYQFHSDVAQFKRMFKVQTQNGKLGLAEKSRARKMLMQDYGLK